MTTYRIELDTSLCSGFGSCVDLAPELFALDGGGVARVVVSETDNPVACDAAGSCPMGAISVTEIAA